MLPDVCYNMNKCSKGKAAPRTKNHLQLFSEVKEEGRSSLPFSSFLLLCWKCTSDKGLVFREITHRFTLQSRSWEISVCIQISVLRLYGQFPLLLIKFIISVRIKKYSCFPPVNTMYLCLWFYGWRRNKILSTFPSFLFHIMNPGPSYCADWLI